MANRLNWESFGLPNYLVGYSYPPRINHPFTNISCRYTITTSKAAQRECVSLSFHGQSIFGGLLRGVGKDLTRIYRCYRHVVVVVVVVLVVAESMYMYEYSENVFFVGTSLLGKKKNINICTKHTCLNTS
jgi:hypothetical protein